MPLLLVGLLLLAGCSSGNGAQPAMAVVEDVVEECKILTLGQGVMVRTEESMREDRIEEYFESDEWLSFERSYWKGFWREHKYCRICNENDDVPEEYK